MALSFQALQDLWKQAGGNPAQAPVAAAIALAESGGNPQSHNAVPPDNSYGLWQINMLGSMGPSRRSAFGLSSNEQLFDPLTNAKAAVALSGGGSNFKAWSTYTNGAYKSHLNGQGAGTDASGNGIPQESNGFAQFFANVYSGGDASLGGILTSIFTGANSQLSGSSLSSFLGPLAPIAGAFAAIGKFMNWVTTTLFMPATWARVASFSLGVVLIFAGLFIFFVGSAPVRAAERIAGDVL
jgi:hypothetical protein